MSFMKKLPNLFSVPHHFYTNVWIIIKYVYCIYFRINFICDVNVFVKRSNFFLVNRTIR